MKNVNVTIPYNEEKLTALRLYAKQKNVSVEGELLQSLESLYTRNVPQNVRAYIAMREQIPDENSKTARPSDEGGGS